MIYRTPHLGADDVAVLDEIHKMRADLAAVLRVPRRWKGGLRRTMLARAIRGSNSIEGYVVTEDDAAAAVDDEEPLSADDLTFREIQGYRHVLGYVLQTAANPHFVFNAPVILSMHYMLLAHDLTKSPGTYRTGPIFVHDDRADVRVYEGPDASLVPGLMEELAERLRDETSVDPMVRAAMAHLNLVMIHPFRDGNGRMARALQTLVLARDSIAEPEFASIEEWLGHNTDDYYRVLAATGQGAWHPENDAGLWVSFNLRAHHMQAQTVAQRIDEVSAIWIELDDLTARHRLPDRVTSLLYEAVLGYRIRRGHYAKLADVEERTASRDLAQLVDLGLLHPVGERRGRHYEAASALVDVRSRCREKRHPIIDPYPWMRARLLSATEAPPPAPAR